MTTYYITEYMTHIYDDIAIECMCHAIVGYREDAGCIHLTE